MSEIRSFSTTPLLLCLPPLPHSLKLGFPGDDNSSSVVGLTADVAYLLAAELNFSMVVVKQADGCWGGQTNGVWDGMVGSLANGDADITLTSLSVTWERQEVIDYTRSLFRTRRGLIASKHYLNYHYSLTRLVRAVISCYARCEPLCYDSNCYVRIGSVTFACTLLFSRYFDAFTLPVWISTGCCVILLSAVLFKVLELGKKFNESILFSECLAYFSVLLIQRDFAVDKDTLTVRITYLAGAFFGCVVFASYSALLTSTMISQPAEPYLETFEDILKKNFRLYLWNSSVPLAMMREAPSDSPMGMVFRSQIRGNPLHTVDSLSEAMRKLESDPRGVFFGYVLSFSPSKFYMVESFKQVKLKGVIDYTLTKLDQSGLIQRLMTKYNIDDDHTKYRAHNVDALGYDNLLFPFVVLVIGAVLGIIVTLGEGLGKRSVLLRNSLHLRSPQSRIQ